MLDPFPYNGATAILEALWMGVPSIGLAGNTHVTRVALSLMSAVGLPEFVAHSTEEYVDTAVRIARDVPRLAAIRASLRERMLRSQLMDHAGLARAVEDAYREMWSALGSAATCAAT
jgi:predicted O-linked N-acetylglucosamine transferase (SPINDLY family)